MLDDATLEIATWMLAFGCMILVVVCRILGVW